MGYIDVFTGYLATTYCGYYAPYDIQNICQVFICMCNCKYVNGHKVGFSVSST